MRNWQLILLMCCSFRLTAQESVKVYLIPGQGSDERIFKNLQFDPAWDTIHIHYITPLENETMHQYAVRLSAQVDTTSPFYIVGVSLGGMIAAEMTDIIHPQKVILISSAASAEEIPAMYTYFKAHPFYKNIHPDIFKYSAFLLQPVYEPDRRTERSTCNSMLNDKDPEFMKEAVSLIVSWDRTSADNAGKNIIHIHGDIDHTLPIENCHPDYIIHNGSHMMTLTKAAEISEILKREIVTMQ